MVILVGSLFGLCRVVLRVVLLIWAVCLGWFCFVDFVILVLVTPVRSGYSISPVFLRFSGLRFWAVLIRIVVFVVARQGFGWFWRSRRIFLV